MDARGWLEQLEERLTEATERDAFPALALLGGHGVALDEDELRASRRRALLLLATGGDPRRGLELDGRAVRALAEDLDNQGARDELEAGLSRLLAAAEGLPRAARALATLRSDGDLAWRSFACALLAEELEEER